MPQPKKETPDPLLRAVDAGVAPRPLSPLRKLAIPAGVAVGLALTGTGLALELRKTGTETESCTRAPNASEHSSARGFNPLGWIQQDLSPPKIAGQMAPASNQPPTAVAATATATATATAKGSATPPLPPPIPTHNYPRPKGEMAMPQLPTTAAIAPVATPPKLAGAPMAAHPKPLPSATK